MSAYTLDIYIDGAASSTVVPVSLSSANECTLRFPLGSTALDARSSRIRCVISDTETEESLADVTATMGRDEKLLAAVTEVVCADAMDVVRKEAPHLGPAISTMGAIEVFKATIGPNFVASRLDAIADDARDRKARLVKRKHDKRSPGDAVAITAASVEDAAKAEAELLALLDEEDETKAKKKKKKKKKKTPAGEDAEEKPVERRPSPARDAASSSDDDDGPTTTVPRRQADS